MHLRKGDNVVVIAGKEKGKRGRVLRLVTDKNRVVIERVNMVKRHTKPTQRNPRGGILEKEGPVELSNVALWCGKCAAARRHRIDVTKDENKKRRVCVKCGFVFEAA
jgi:large subunit ribosomal protein L24